MADGVELLVFGGNARAAARIARDLAQVGLDADSSTDESEARAKFLDRGGHGWLLITEDAQPGAAARLARALQSVDPGLRIMIFGRGLATASGLGQLHRVPSLYPGSRAGLGAVQRLLATR